MRTRTPAQIRKERRKRQGVIYISGSILILLVVLVSYIALKQNAVVLDSATMCPCEREPSAYYALLLDVTDRYSDIERAYIKRSLEDLKREIPQYGKISIYVIHDKVGKVLDPVVTLCNPGTGEGVSKVTGNPALLEERWFRAFSAPIDSLLDSVLELEASGVSPIMEAIQAISFTAFSHIGTGKSQNPKKLVIVSDMLQHTSGFSQYRSQQYDCESFVQSPYYERVRSHLLGVSVSILYLSGGEYSHLQGTRHIRFWEEFLQTLDASLVRVERVPG